MKFFTPGTEKFVCNSGSGLVQQYAPKVNDDGTITLVEDGVFDLYAQIQADAEANSIPAILKRFENGDPSGFSGQPMYGDFTELPKTYAEFLQAQINADRIWDQLAPSIKEKFDNNKDLFFVTSGTDEWMSKVSGVVSTQDTEKKSDTKGE